MMHNMPGGSAYTAGPRGAAVRAAQHITHSSTSQRVPSKTELSQIGRSISGTPTQPQSRPSSSGSR
jgi:hypothetical protein